MKLARSETDLENAFRTAQVPRPRPPSAMTRSISRNIFGRPRHIEVQVFGDGKGRRGASWENATVSLQRRHQKVLEGSPRPLHRSRDPHAHRRNLRACQWPIWATRAPARSSFSTRTANFYFIEMNTRLQVEHPVTEAIFGVDLVREQIQVAAGMPMSFAQDDLRLKRPRHRGAHQRRKAAELLPLPRPHQPVYTRRGASASGWIRRCMTAIRSRPITTA